MPPTRTPRLKARVAIEHDGQILCVLHAKPDQEPFWCLPGGNVDNAESLSDAACRELQGLQPLYLIPNTPANAARIAAQALLICSLYQLAAWLGEVSQVDWWLSRASGRRHPEFAAYLLGELKLAKKVGVLPLAANEVLTSS